MSDICIYDPHSRGGIGLLTSFFVILAKSIHPQPGILQCTFTFRVRNIQLHLVPPLPIYTTIKSRPDADKYLTPMEFSGPFRIKGHMNGHLYPTETMRDTRYLGCPFRPLFAVRKPNKDRAYSEEMSDASGIRGGEPMNGAAAQRSATDLGNLTALTDDVDVMSINITWVACCMEGPKNRVIPRPQNCSNLSDGCDWAPLKQRMPITEFDASGLRTMGINVIMSCPNQS